MGVRRLVVANGPNIFQMLLVWFSISMFISTKWRFSQSILFEQELEADTLHIGLTAAAGVACRPVPNHVNTY